MIGLSGFKPFNFNEGVPYISITKNGITFNKSCIIKLDYPTNVVLLINESEKLIAIQRCDPNAPNAAKFFNGSKGKNTMLVRWNSRDLKNTICELTDWNLDFDSYKIEGVLMKEDDAILFDLRRAIKL